MKPPTGIWLNVAPGPVPVTVRKLPTFAALNIHTAVELTHYAILQGWVDAGDALTPDLKRRLRGHTLSHRQQRIADLLAEGYTQPQIAADLGISKSTVQVYRTRLRSYALPSASVVRPDGHPAGGLRPTTPKTWASLLSRRERQIAELLAEGYTHPQIAQRLGIGLPAVL